jgi:hypothetical protein
VKMKNVRKSLMAIGVALLSFCAKSNAQTTSATSDEPRKVKVQLLVNGKVHPPNQTLTRADGDIQLKIFSMNGNISKPLVITNMDVNLMRNGQRISTVSLPGAGSIASLVSKAQNNDIYLLELKEIYEEQADATLKKYTKGVVKVKYWFYDSMADPNNQQIILGSNK